MMIFLTPSIIKEKATDEKVFNTGFELYNEKAVTDINFAKQGSFYVMSAQVEENSKKNKVFCVFSQVGMLQRFSCGCDSSRMWKGACRHTCAALFAFLYQSRDKEAELEKTRAANALLAQFEKISLKSGNKRIAPIPEDEKFSLEPELSINDVYSRNTTGVYLSFRVGAAKKYVVKNISNFLSAVKADELVSYGKNLAFVHSRVNFDEFSQKILDFLLTEEENAENYIVSSYGSYYSSPYYEREMSVSNKGLDILFDLFLGRKISAKIVFNPVLLEFSPSDVPVSYQITEDDTGINLNGQNKFSRLKGAAYDYLIVESSIYRIDREKFAVIEALERELKNNINGVHFTKDVAGKFISYVLPQLKRQNLADTSAVEKNHNISELTKKVYLDEENMTITAKVLFCYAELEINALSRENTDIIRDGIEEANLKSVINQFGFTEDFKNSRYFLNDSSKIFNFYRFGVDSLNELAEVFATDDFKKKSQKVSYTKTTFGIRMKGDLLSIAPTSSDYSMRELLDIVDSFNAKKKFHRLKDGRFIDLTDADLKDTAEFLESLDIEGRDIKNDGVNVHASRAMYIDSLITGEDSAFFNRDEAFKKLTEDFKSGRDKKFEVPVSLEKILRGYQKEGFYWLAMMSHYKFGGILADDMGLGKTLQIIALMLYAKETEGSTKASLVVAPTSLIYNWEKEFKRFAPQLNTLVISSAARKRKEDITPETDAIITTYDILKRDLDFFTEYNYKYVISDEAQNIKNPTTQNAKAVKQLSAHARFALTGTPVENSLSELWSIFDFAMPGYLRNYSKFSKEYETPITKNKDAEKAGRLKKQIAPFILRRVKKDVLSEIPDKLETNLYAEMTEQQKRVYAAYHLKAKGELDDINDKNMMKESRIKILSFITRLRQICCHPGVFINNYSGGSGKLSVVMETVKNCAESGHRMLLFSQFTSILDIVKNELDGEGISYFYIDGATPAKARSEMADRFNAGENPIFLISLKAGGTGLNLTGADVVIHFDPWWNPAVMDQASDRAHRIGQKNVVQVFNVVSKDTIEEKILALQEKKRDLIDLVIEGGANFINKLSTEEIYELFA
ncbi:MAG: DEAD/DEAH box helicase [Clostridiales bacterium]|jgi:SNF2 family DNA or RNA helicase|nr:DEAD/DEAH box helicase [Clostridiales bacterium]